MNRRTVLIGLAASGIAATRGLAGCQGVTAQSYLELRLSPKAAQAPYAVEEFGADSKSAGVIRCDDERGLTLLLRRTAKDPAAPKQLRLSVEDGSKLETVLSAVHAIRAGEFAKVKYYGCIPPGCGILTGAAMSMPRHAGSEFDATELEKTLTNNSIKC